ncbi:MAG: glycosyl hydrolase, partial [Actinotalea sp.]|nr:glycosyl hydrolase [Actinotalea sp.]
APMPRASAIHGCIAIERGPLVYCIEQADNPGLHLGDLRVDTRRPPTDVIGPDLVDGLVAVTVEGRVVPPPPSHGPAYRPITAPSSAHVDADAYGVTLTAIPYLAWANRGSNAMRVWLPRLDQD